MPVLSVPPTLRQPAMTARRKTCDVDEAVAKLDVVLSAVDGAGRLARGEGENPATVLAEVAAILDLASAECQKVIRKLHEARG